MPQHFEPESSGEGSVARVPAVGRNASRASAGKARRRPDLATFEKNQDARRKRRAIVNLCVAWTCVGFGAVAASVYAAPVGYKILYPYQLSAQVRQEADALERRLSQQKEKNESLRRDIARLQTSAGIESEARKITWRWPGETVYYVPATDRDAVSEKNNTGKDREESPGAGN